jgi:hypothetical protein
MEDVVEAQRENDQAQTHSHVLASGAARVGRGYASRSAATWSAGRVAARRLLVTVGGGLASDDVEVVDNGDAPEIE